MATREQLIAWHARWAEVNDAADSLAAAKSPLERLRDVAPLQALAVAVPLVEWPDDDEPAVWARFQRLRSIHRARNAGR